MEWTDSAINIWFFSPSAIPETLYSTQPDPSAFGVPSASFSGPCSSQFSERFFNHTLVIDTTFCGSWAGRTFGTDEDSECPLLEGATPEESCIAYVANNPEAFKDAYWDIRSLRVWQREALTTVVNGTNQTAGVPVSPLTVGVLVDESEVYPVPVETEGDGGFWDGYPDDPIPSEPIPVEPIPIDPGIGDGAFWEGYPDDPIPSEPLQIGRAHV